VCPPIWLGGPADHAITITDYIQDAERFRHWWSLYGSPNDEVWVSETGCLDPSLCPDLNDTTYISAITAYLNNEGRWINRYAWYTDYDGKYYKSWLMTDTVNGNFTGIGTFYSQVVPATHVPGFRYLTFLQMVRKDGSSGNSAMINPDLSTFVSPLPVPSTSSFNSPVATPAPTRTRMP
jgi:hypothetical protein